jgi:hypothetical protein
MTVRNRFFKVFFFLKPIEAISAVFFCTGPVTLSREICSEAKALRLWCVQDDNAEPRASDVGPHPNRFPVEFLPVPCYPITDTIHGGIQERTHGPLASRLHTAAV